MADGGIRVANALFYLFWAGSFIKTITSQINLWLFSFKAWFSYTILTGNLADIGAFLNK